MPGGPLEDSALTVRVPDTYMWERVVQDTVITCACAQIGYVYTYMYLRTSVCVAQGKHTLLLLFLLECEVECPDGEVHSLWVGLADVEQKVQDSLASH